MPMTDNERDTRLDIFNSLLTTPHRDLAALLPLHREASSSDPHFYARLGVWNHRHGEVRDHKAAFIAFLLAGPLPEGREAGFVLLQDLAPYEVRRAVEFMRRRHGSGVGKFPTSARTAVTYYLREIESDPARFDRAAATSREAVKWLYAALHLRPAPYVEKALFQEQPEEGTQLWAIRELSKTSEPAEQARIIARARLPYRAAVGALTGKLTPVVLLALVDRMTPPEVINNLSSLKERGALEHDEVRKMVEAKIEQAKTGGRVSSLKARKAAGAARVDEQMATRLKEVSDQRVAARGRIRMPTLLLVDKSRTMEAAIEAGRRCAALISGITEAALYVYACDSVGMEVKARGAAMSDWDDAFQFVFARGRTSLGAGLYAALGARRYVEQIIIVTDERENTDPRFRAVYDRYAAEMKVSPRVVIVKVGDHTTELEEKLDGIAGGVETFEISAGSDYYSLPNLVPLLAAPSRIELLTEIMQIELPRREQLRPRRAAAGGKA